MQYTCLSLPGVQVAFVKPTSRVPRPHEGWVFSKPQCRGTWPGTNKGDTPLEERKIADTHLACWQGSGTCLDYLCPAPPAAKPGQPSGISLTDVCDNDRLLKPILDLLDFINQKWPLTKDIFRTVTSKESCRSIKEELNSGDKGNCDGNQENQGSVFSSSLSDKWLADPKQGESEDEKLSATWRLLDQLPRAHAALLRYLFGVLHIEQQMTHKMTAYVIHCIAQRLLCLPSPCNTDYTHSEGSTSSEGTHHTLLLHGHVELRRGGRAQQRHLFFYSDLLLVSDTNSLAGFCWKFFEPAQAHPGSALFYQSKTAAHQRHLQDSDQKRKSCRSIKEQLNSGDKRNWDGESVSVAEVVLKDFFENIQGSVFSSSLYGKCLGDTEQGESEDEKITVTWRLLDEVPRANVVPLQYLFGPLHNIEQQATHKMRAL
nr:rho GTPase-activating protein 20-like [Manis javanica]